MKANRKLINFLYFKEILGGNWKRAYANFKHTDEEDNMICSSYDSEGFCLFEKTDTPNVWEFTGTAK